MNNAHLELTGVGISFPSDKGLYCALQNVNLKIDKGEFVSLIGHSGCGKSTVLNIVAGLYQATTGGVILDSREAGTYINDFIRVGDLLIVPNWKPGTLRAYRIPVMHLTDARVRAVGEGAG